MPSAVTRRRFLRGVAVLGATGMTGVGVGRARQSRDAGRFTPVEHAFGFRNWSPDTQYFDPPPGPTRAEVREMIQAEWPDRFQAALGSEPNQLPSALVDAISGHLRTAVVQLAGTNGHCYGMVLAAQRYFERPDTIPVDRPVASEIEHPTVPIDQPEAPVYEDIVQLQAEQFLRFRAWLGRRALAHRAWIDTGAVLEDIRAVLETFGTASLLLFNGELYGHQVLAYDYREDGPEVMVSMYDPNRTAASYRNGPSTLRFVREDETATMRPYQVYSGVLFNRYDRIERVPGRESASPLDHLTVDPATVRASLFPLAQVRVDAAAADLTVVDPDGAPLERIRGTHMDRTRGGAGRMRVRYGAAPGTYRVSVFATRATSYELRAIVSGLEGEVVDETRRDHLAAGTVHEYELDIAESGGGTLTRAGQDRRGTGLIGGVGALGGVAAGALGYRVLQERRHRDSREANHP